LIAAGWQQILTPDCPRGRIFYSPQLKNDPPSLLFQRFWLALVGFLIVQSMHIHMQENDFALPVCLKFQIDRFVTKMA
jgi:hypothetical protein